jgi:nitrate/nitrite-specific signal transduction histidine kinase
MMASWPVRMNAANTRIMISEAAVMTRPVSAWPRITARLLSPDSADVHVEIDDDGTASAEGPAAIGTGSGITGMRERATALGGDLSAGFRRGGGFRVSARLPVRSSR